MEKKSTEGKSSGGKVARQIATLKTTLKHTTDNILTLEKNIEAKGKESEELLKRLEEAEDLARQDEKKIFQFHAENVLAKKIQKQVNQGKLTSLQKESNVFEDLANGKYKPASGAEAIKEQLKAEKDLEIKLRSILDSVRGENEGYGKLISLINWE